MFPEESYAEEVARKDREWRAAERGKDAETSGLDRLVQDRARLEALPSPQLGDLLLNQLVAAPRNLVFGILRSRAAGGEAEAERQLARYARK